MEGDKGITQSGSVEITNPKLVADLNLATSKLSAEWLKIQKMVADTARAAQKAEEKINDAGAKVAEGAKGYEVHFTLGLTEFAMDIQRQMNELEAEHKAKVSELKAQMADSELAESEFKAKVKSMEVDNKRALEDVVKANKRSLNELQEAHNSDMGILKSRLAAEMESINTTTLVAKVESKGYKALEVAEYGKLKASADDSIKNKESADKMKESMIAAKSEAKEAQTALVLETGKLNNLIAFKDEKINDLIAQLKEAKEANIRLTTALTDVNKPKS
jgi:hypothetical protein